jgi:hypothetical protein
VVDGLKLSFTWLMGAQGSMREWQGSEWLKLEMMFGCFEHSPKQVHPESSCSMWKDGIRNRKAMLYRRRTNSVTTVCADCVSYSSVLTFQKIEDIFEGLVLSLMREMLCKAIFDNDDGVKERRRMIILFLSPWPCNLFDASIAFSSHASSILLLTMMVPRL